MGFEGGTVVAQPMGLQCPRTDKDPGTEVAAVEAHRGVGRANVCLGEETKEKMNKNIEFDANIFLNNGFKKVNFQYYV